MKKGTRVKCNGCVGTFHSETGFINIKRNKLVRVGFDNEPHALFLVDITKLEVISND